MRILSTANFLRRWLYATADRGTQFYYALSPVSTRLLLGDMDAPVRSAGPVGISRHFHTQSLAEFRVHTLCAAAAAGFTLTDMYSENALRLDAAGGSIYPDWAFTMLTPDRPPLQFFVELDNGTEPVISHRARDSWRRKLGFYEALRDTCGYRFRVLGIITRSTARLDHILTTAAAMARIAERPLFYGICLKDYLAQQSPLLQPCFRDHRGKWVAVVPSPVLAERSEVC